MSEIIRINPSLLFEELADEQKMGFCLMELANENTTFLRTVIHWMCEFEKEDAERFQEIKNKAIRQYCGESPVLNKGDGI